MKRAVTLLITIIFCLAAKSQIEFQSYLNHLQVFTPMQINPSYIGFEKHLQINSLYGWGGYEGVNNLVNAETYFTSLKSGMGVSIVQFSNIMRSYSLGYAHHHTEEAVQLSIGMAVGYQKLQKPYYINNPIFFDEEFDRDRMYSRMFTGQLGITIEYNSQSFTGGYTSHLLYYRDVVYTSYAIDLEVGKNLKLIPEFYSFFSWDYAALSSKIEVVYKDKIMTGLMASTQNAYTAFLSILLGKKWETGLASTYFPKGNLRKTIYDFRFDLLLKYTIR